MRVRFVEQYFIKINPAGSPIANCCLCSNCCVGAASLHGSLGMPCALWKSIKALSKKEDHTTVPGVLIKQYYGH